jgi:hypothetical protein
VDAAHIPHATTTPCRKTTFAELDVIARIAACRVCLPRDCRAELVMSCNLGHRHHGFAESTS